MSTARALSATGVLAACVLVVGCNLIDGRTAKTNVYTLYRSSAIVGGENMRVHVATFDAIDGARYNQENCDVARGLFAGQPGLRVRYWCERGYFSKS